MGFIKDLKVSMEPAGKSIKEMLPDLQKAIRAKDIKALLVFGIVGLSVLVIPIFVVSFVVSLVFPSFPDGIVIFSMLLLPAGVIGITSGWPRLQRERVRLSWRCDRCYVPMRADFEILEKTVKINIPQKKVVTGSHYEFSHNASGNVIAREVLETRDELTGPIKYEVKAKVRVTLHCEGCKHQEVFVVEDVSFTSKDKENYNDVKIEDSVLQKLADSKGKASPVTAK